jgi:hypothetical protein
MTGRGSIVIIFKQVQIRTEVQGTRKRRKVPPPTPPPSLVFLVVSSPNTKHAWFPIRTSQGYRLFFHLKDATSTAVALALGLVWLLHRDVKYEMAQPHEGNHGRHCSTYYFLADLSQIIRADIFSFCVILRSFRSFCFSCLAAAVFAATIRPFSAFNWRICSVKEGWPAASCMSWNRF